MEVEFSGATDRGKRRKSNEDSFGVFKDLNFAIVADGMGGHAGGEVASRLAVETVHQAILQNSHKNSQERLDNALQKANTHILETAKKDPALSGMGTTVVTFLLSGKSVHIGYAGDSRAYLYRESKLQQITEDHSLVRDYIRKGLLTPEEAKQNPLKHVITRALGTHETIQIDHRSVLLGGDDIFLLCSDGLSNMVSLDELQRGLAAPRRNLDETCKGLIHQANENGGSDNITLVLVHCREGSP